MNNTKLNELQHIQLDIFCEFIRVCEKLNLRYYLIEGSMLGAKRHNGFIPWDDDIDVGMPRRDYEIFQKKANNYLEPRYHLSRVCDKQHYWMTGILQDKTSPIILQNARNNVSSYAGIDVIPLDGCPNGVLRQWLHYQHFYFYRMLYQASNFSNIVNVNKKRNPLEACVVTLFLKIKLENFLNSKKIIRKLHRILGKYDFDTSHYVASYISDYRMKEIMPRTWYGAGKEFPFENTVAMGVACVHEYLCKLYGDYMCLPSEENRQGKHNVVLIKA